MGEEVAAFMEGFDNAFSISRDLEAMLGHDVLVHMYTDSKQRFDALTREKYTTERRLMTEIVAARQEYHRLEIAATGPNRREDNPANGFNNVEDNGALRK